MHGLRQVHFVGWWTNLKKKLDWGSVSRTGEVSSLVDLEGEIQRTETVLIFNFKDESTGGFS